MTKPHILVARAIFPETLARLAQQFEVEANPDDAIWTKAQLIERLQGKVGAFTTGSERCLLYTSPSPRDRTRSRMPSSA